MCVQSCPVVQKEIKNNDVKIMIVMKDVIVCNPK